MSLLKLSFDDIEGKFSLNLDRITNPRGYVCGIRNAENLVYDVYELQLGWFIDVYENNQLIDVISIDLKNADYLKKKENYFYKFLDKLIIYNETNTTYSLYEFDLKNRKYKFKEDKYVKENDGLFLEGEYNTLLFALTRISNSIAVVSSYKGFSIFDRRKVGK